MIIENLWYHGITKSQHCNNDDNDNDDNDDNVMCVNVWFEVFSGLFYCQNPRYMRGNYDYKEGDSNWARPFLGISGYKSGSGDITKGSIMEVKV